MVGKLTGGVAALTLLVGGPVVAESYARHQSADSVREAVHDLAPGTPVASVEPHGRPFVASLLSGSVSSAYVDLGGAAAGTTLIVEQLHRDTGVVEGVEWFAHVKPPVGLDARRLANGAYTPSGYARIGGRRMAVTYRATLVGRRIIVRPATVTSDGQVMRSDAIPEDWRRSLTPPPLRLPASGALRVRAVSVGDGDITVELHQRRARTAGAQHRKDRG